MNQQSLKFIQALKDHADILSKYLEEHPEALARIVSELPTHQEPKQTFRVKWDGEDAGRPMRSCCQCGETIPVEFLGAEMHWCQPKVWHGEDFTCKNHGSGPKKVDMLVEELAHGFRNYADIGKNYEWSLADYAVKFFKARMPKFVEYGYKASNDAMAINQIRNETLKDVRLNLFGEA